MDTIHINNAWDCVNSNFFLFFRMVDLTVDELRFRERVPPLYPWFLSIKASNAFKSPTARNAKQTARRANRTNRETWQSRLTVSVTWPIQFFLNRHQCIGMWNVCRFNPNRRNHRAQEIELMGRCRTCNWSSSIGAYGLIAHANQIKSYHIDSLFFFQCFWGLWSHIPAADPHVRIIHYHSKWEASIIYQHLPQ